MRSVPHGGLGAGAQLRVLLDAGQLGGRLEEVVHRVLALQGRNLGEVRVLKIVREDYILSSGHKSEFLISKFNIRQIKLENRACNFVRWPIFEIPSRSRIFVSFIFWTSSQFIYLGLAIKILISTDERKKEDFAHLFHWL